MELDDVALRLQERVYSQTLRNPAGRHQIVGKLVYGRLTGWAIGDATAEIDGPRPRRSVVDRLLRRPTEPRPPVPSRREHEAAWMERRLRKLRGEGVELRQVGGGWQRRVGNSTKWVPVETASQLVQARVRAGERAAVLVARNHAGRLGVKVPPVRGADWSKIDPAVAATYYRTVAMHTSRIAHDALVDAWRDAAFDRLLELGEGWVRECEPTACGACMALCDGAVHPPTYRTFYRHTRCRCRPRRASLPRPKTGQQIIDGMGRAELGRHFYGRGGQAKADALIDGQISLQDLLLVDAKRVGRTDYVIGEAPAKGLPIADA